MATPSVTIVTAEVALLLLGLLGLGVWGVVTGVRNARRTASGSVTAPQLSSLANPYRTLLAQALEVQREVATQAARAPGPLEAELGSLARRVERLVERALPRARHGTDLSTYLLRLTPDEPQYAQTERAARRVEKELSDFLETLKLIRGKVYQILTDATALSRDAELGRDLEDALLEVDALEQAFGETSAEFADAFPDPVAPRTRSDEPRRD